MANIVKKGWQRATHPIQSMDYGIEQHKCIYGGGGQGTLSLRACDKPLDPDFGMNADGGSYRHGGLVTQGSHKEKSRLKGYFKIV